MVKESSPSVHVDGYSPKEMLQKSLSRNKRSKAQLYFTCFSMKLNCMPYEFTMIQGHTIHRLIFLMKDGNQLAIFLQMFFSSVCMYMYY